MKKILQNLAKKYLNSFTIKVEGKPYLTRYYLFGKDRELFNVYIHHFHSSDLDKELHNHPWKWAYTFIFDGGYDEQYREGKKIGVRSREAPFFGPVKCNVFHRVTLHDEDQGAWSVFFAGPRITTKPEWEFWDYETDRQFYYKEKSHAID